MVRRILCGRKTQLELAAEGWLESWLAAWENGAALPTAQKLIKSLSTSKRSYKREMLRETAL